MINRRDGITIPKFKIQYLIFIAFHTTDDIKRRLVNSIYRDIIISQGPLIVLCTIPLLRSLEEGFFCNYS
jgi:hypothetical protein